MSEDTEIDSDPREVIEELLSQNNWESISITEVSKELKDIFKDDSEEFFKLLRMFPNEVLADLLLEFTEKILGAILNEFTVSRFVDIFNQLESDDATDLFQELEDLDKDKAIDIFSNLEFGEQNEIRRLKRYPLNVAGAYMQTELFGAKLQERIEDAINRLRRLKKIGELENVHQVFITGVFNRLIAIIDLQDLITFDFSNTFEEAISGQEEKFNPITVTEHQDIEEVLKAFGEYDLASIAVVNSLGSLLGRITGDDIYDIQEENATEQIYNLAGVDDDAEQEDTIKEAGKTRALWLLLNLFTAFVASMVISFFDTTIQAYVALAVLMPIVASMGGNAGTQTLTVMVRKLALGEIDLSDSKEAVKREFTLAFINGLIFSSILSATAYIWFKIPALSLVIFLAMIINLIVAGIAGATIPLLLKRFDMDPAVGSSVLLTATTDIVGFLSFLGIATLLL